MQIFVENSAGGNVGAVAFVFFDDLSVMEISKTDTLLTPVENYTTDSDQPLLKNTEQFHSITSNDILGRLYATSERFIHQSVDGTD